MEISDKTEWLYPVRLRVAKKVLPSRNVGVVFEPIISRGERVYWNDGIAYHQTPDRVVGATIVLAGPDDLEDGLLEFWTKNPWTDPDEYPFVYFAFEHVEWKGSVGHSDTKFGFMLTTSRTSGRRELLSHFPTAKI